ncbi:uncharacterized protein LOC141513167 [Macrotis lagotis]|uniref:uncharacterized protein LOC141513167 n=1 Tax=Macrotis lagotis TaxID=92651 RepID=UPI003D68507D
MLQDRKKKESHGTSTRQAIYQDLPCSSPVTPPASPLPLEEPEPRHWARSRTRQPSGKKRSKDGRVGDGYPCHRVVSPGRCWPQALGADSSILSTIPFLRCNPKAPRLLWLCRCPSVPPPSTRTPSRNWGFGGHEHGNSSRRIRRFCSSVPPYFPTQCSNSRGGGFCCKITQPSHKILGEGKKEKPERHGTRREKKQRQNVMNNTEFGPQILGVPDSSVPVHLTSRFRELPGKMRSSADCSAFEGCKWAEETFFKQVQKDDGKGAQKPERKSRRTKKFRQHRSTPRNGMYILPRRNEAGKVK